MAELANKKNTSGLSKPGMTNNPNGRPKTPESVKLAFAGMMPLALDAMRAILDGSDTDARPADRIKAADIVFDRNLGKPMQSVEMKSEVKTVDVSKLTKEQMDALTDLAIGAMEDDGR